MTTIFVFGSNLAGRHGKGAALHAKNNCGARYGVGVGRTGDAYAIPTKNYDLTTLPLQAIKAHVRNSIKYAHTNQDLTFQVTRIGCGLAGYKDHQIAPMFAFAPWNCELPTEWKALP